MACKNTTIITVFFTFLKETNLKFLTKNIGY